MEESEAIDSYYLILRNGQKGFIEKSSEFILSYLKNTLFCQCEEGIEFLSLDKKPIEIEYEIIEKVCFDGFSSLNVEDHSVSLIWIIPYKSKKEKENLESN